jgi:CDP-glucose 4,6-dehydratase
VNPRFWAGKTVLVTGHTGFKGTWLALWLHSMGADVAGFARSAPTRPALFELVGLADLVEHLTGDVRDLDDVRAAVARTRPEIVFHLAAQPLVRRSYEEPVETYATNVMGTVNLLEAVRQSGHTRVVVNVTTDKCYENRGWEWGYREYEPKGGSDPYSSSKACSELVTDAYRSSFFGAADDGASPAVASARAGNVIGGGDWAADRLVPDFMRAALEGRTLNVRNPDAVRPWQHVLNPLSGYLLLAESLWRSDENATGWNFGPEEQDARPVRWIADRLVEMWGEGLTWELEGRPQPAEAQYLKLDSSRARARLAWAPRWDLEEALRRTVEWFRAYRDGGDVREVSLRQVAEHQAGEPAGTQPGASPTVG